MPCNDLRDLIESGVRMRRGFPIFHVEIRK